MEPQQNPYLPNKSTDDAATPDTTEQVSAETLVQQVPIIINPTPMPEATEPSSAGVSASVDISPASQPSAATAVTPQTPAAPQSIPGIDEADTMPATIAPDPTAEPATNVIPPATISQQPTVPTPSTPITFVGAPSTPLPTNDGTNKKKLFIIGGSVLAALVLLTGGAFGLYLPNTPDNVWSTGINRSGKALDTLVTSAASPEKLKSYKTSDITGTVDAKMGSARYSGDLKTVFDKTALKAALNVKVDDGNGTNAALNAQLLSKLTGTSPYPSLYFQISGLKSIGIDQFAPQLAAYDGRWISVDSAYLQSLGDAYGGSTGNTTTQVTTEDIADVVKTISAVTRQYVFTTDADKAVLVQKRFIAKEKLDGITAYHYSAGINETQAKDYCVAVSNAVISTEAYKKLSGQKAAELAEAKKSAAESCKTDNEDLKNSSFDLWIDGKYKLIHKVRIYDDTDRSIYTEFGQRYKGGDKLSLFANYQDPKQKSRFTGTVDTDLKTNNTTSAMQFDSTDTANPYSVTVKLNADLTSKPVDVTVPANPTSIQDVLKKLGIDPAAPAGTAY